LEIFYKNSLVVAKSVADFSTPSISITVNSEVLPLNNSCFDIWTDINKPQIYIDQNINNKKYLIVVIPGRCDSIYKIDINFPHLIEGIVQVVNPAPTLNKEITSSTYSNITKILYYAYKGYNSLDLSIKCIDVALGIPLTCDRKFNANETIPVMTFNPAKNELYMATMDFDKIYRMNGDPSSGLAVTGIATLPVPLRAVSAINIHDDFLYLATWEPNAQFGRISLVTGFCPAFCGPNGFCSNPQDANPCACAPGFSQDPNKNYFDCAPTHEVDIYKNEILERSLATTLGVLFAISLIIAVVGWVFWWRKRNQLVKSF